jgi:hypothetical protein
MELSEPKKVASSPKIDKDTIDTVSSYLEQEDKASKKASGAVDAVLYGAAEVIKEGRKLNREHDMVGKAATAAESIKAWSEENKPVAKATAAFEQAKKFNEKNDVLLTARAVFEMGVEALKSVQPPRQAKKESAKAVEVDVNVARVEKPAKKNVTKKKKGFF